MKSILNFFLFLVFTDGVFVKTNIYQKKKSEVNAIMGPIPLNDNSYKLIDKILDIKIDEERNLGRIIVEKTSSDSRAFFI